MATRRILLTFDYELFLGVNSGRINDCLIDPTQKVTAVMDRFGLKGIFFVDLLYLVRLKEELPKYPELQEDMDRVISQLRELAE